MSPVFLRRRFPGAIGNKDVLHRRTSKTLPRGLGLLTVGHALDNCDVYGLYGELMKDYEDEHGVDPVYETMRRSDPDLSAVPNRITTLDRRLQMKTARPRSLDMSSWSMDSKHSSHTSASTTSSQSNSSSGSTDADNASLAMPSVSRMPSFNASTPSSGKSSSRSIHIPLPCDQQSRTLIAITGGRGYVNIRRGGADSKANPGGKYSTTTPLVNYKDAHVMVWEIKA
jgi:Rho guanine nucleotide exchange factor 10